MQLKNVKTCKIANANDECSVKHGTAPCPLQQGDRQGSWPLQGRRPALICPPLSLSLAVAAHSQLACLAWHS